MVLKDVTLHDKYSLDSGRIYLSGTQALVRLPLLQRRRDRAQGLNTAGFISGYRGSPLGTYDQALWQAKQFLQANDIAFVPGLNEDLAATAVWGSQQVGLFPGAKNDGVFSIWYGKGPGVDRSLDALKHANSAGTARYGGVLALAGDDHGCQSSTLAHQSEQVFAAAMMPVLNPATIQDYLDFGLLGFALSRFSGCWVGFKAISETVESSASIYTDPARVEIVSPDDFEPPEGGLWIRWPDPPLEQERRLHGPKMEAVAAFARANRLDRTVLESPAARLGIVTTGKAYLDLRQALAELGLSERAAAEIGLSIYKVGMTWPLEAEGVRRFAEGLQDILVVEEKRGFVEDQLTRILFTLDASKRPSVAGKCDETGNVLLPSHGELTPTIVAGALLNRLRRLGHHDPMLEQRLDRIRALDRVTTGAIKQQRMPFFCSGCPHNTSTKVPEGSRALAGIGCHGMAMFVPARNTATISHMGGEGVAWIGQAPFTSEKHVFQNLGDGTYTHSGLLALRAAAAAGVNITYKILYNDAVAMTGGQPTEGGLTVLQIAQQVAAEGAKRVAIVSDEPGKYLNRRAFPKNADFHHRRDLEQVQRQLREIQGLTVLIYDQTCAAEKRRRRKRGLYPDPPKFAFINDLVCEGCGDCSAASNCISVQPLETDFGRKRQIDQSGCNKDFSCIEGFCPSFVTVRGAHLRRGEKPPAKAEPFVELPTPSQKPLVEPYNILIAGVGGTGVITIGAILGMAAHLEGKACTSLDFTGLAQKNGAVMSHVRLAASPEDISAVRIPAGGADLLLGCDMVVSASPGALGRLQLAKTHAVINADIQPTASFVTNTDVDFEADLMRRVIRDAVGEANADFINASAIATSILGDSIATNAFMLGFAFQKGLIPLSIEAILKAFELNGAAVAMNSAAFSWGRVLADNPSRVLTAVGTSMQPPKKPKSLDEAIAYRAEFLTDYQDRSYSDRYLAAVNAVRTAESAASPSSTELTRAFAESLFKLMAYKDEYEVARLYTQPQFMEKLKAKFEGDIRLSFHLAPPLFARRDPLTKQHRKSEYGPWMMVVFRLLARLKGLRGTRYDLFGYSQERKAERRLIADYEAMIEKHCRHLTASKIPHVVKLARLPQMIRGYGHVKAANIRKYEDELRRLEADIQRRPVPVHAL